MYATDSGLEHAIWYIKYGDLAEVLTSPAYDVYDYNTTWSYNLPEQLNDRDVTVSVENVWVPMGIPLPGKAEAQNIIESGKLVVFTTVPDTATCQVNIVFYPDPGDELEIETMGLWLSPGFEYVADSSSFGEPTTLSHAGGQAILWDFDGTPFVDFPGVDSEYAIFRSSITVLYTSTHETNILETVS